MLKNIPDEVIEAIFSIFSLAISCGYFPKAWRRAKVCRILKKGRDRKLSSNYRPIILLSNLGKLFESLVKNSLESSMESSKLVPEIHSGLRRNRSTQENLWRLSENIDEALKRKRVVIGAFVDLDKAFDGLDHDLIRVKLIKLELPKKLIRIISSFLKDRTLFVQEGIVRSSEVDMRAGSPRGSILSPSIFIIFTSDVPLVNDLEEGASVFADDNNCWVSGENVDEATAILQRRLRIFENRCAKWNLSPATAKSSVICFSRKKRTRLEAKAKTIRMGGKRVEFSPTVKFLGTLYDECFSFKPHVENMIKNCYPMIQSIRKLSKFNLISNHHIVTSLIDSLILSTFTYSSPAYAGMSDVNWLKIDSFFAKMLKKIFSIPYSASNELVMKFFFGKRMSERIKIRTGNRIRPYCI